MQRHIEAKGLGRFHVDDQLELDGGLHGKFARLLALEDAIDIGRGQPNMTSAPGQNPKWRPLSAMSALL
jgi:hypothetical protein